MKNKRLFSISFILVFAFIMSVLFVGCDFNNKNQSPQDLIVDAYGNQEFNIFFSSESLDTPIKDMKYSANNIPLLPTPKKIGFIFEGWFFDDDFTMPYTDGALLLCMQDVTLYPKWSKEEFINNGTYDIDFDCHIVEGSVKKGKTTDMYGGFVDFSDALIRENCYIEKNDDNLILKLQYDCGVTTPFQARGEVFSVRMNKQMNTDIYVKNKVDSLSDPVKTLFFTINSWDLASTFLLDVDWTNFTDKSLNEANRYETTTSYTVAIDLTKIIGFSEAFADPNIPLEEGYYLAKSYYRRQDNGESMATPYNPVYSYVYVDSNKNYKLIKQNTPYLGLVANEHPLFSPLTNNYYDLMMAFTSMTTAIDIDSRGTQGLVESDYYPKTYKAGSYHKTVTEFHADTGKFYNIIDLDKDLSKEYFVLTGVSGWMERSEGMGYVQQILSIDYQNLVKLAQCDYTPLDGDCYEFTRDSAYYPGNYSDLDQKNVTYSTIEKYGINMEMSNFYFSAPSKDAKLEYRQMFSSRVEVCPTRQTSQLDVSQSRYTLGEFEINTKVYGYDVRDGQNLYVDRMSPQILAGNGFNNQLRNVSRVVTGKSCKDNEIIEIDQLYREKVNRNLDFADVIYQAFEVNDSVIDFDKNIIIENKKITFNKDLAIEFTRKQNNKNIKTIVFLKHETQPVIDVYDENYVKKDDYTFEYSLPCKVEDNINYPKVMYTWGEHKDKFIDNYYTSESGDSIDPSRIIIIGNRDGYKVTYLPTSHNDCFIIPESNITVMYQLENEFQERKFLKFNYISEAKPAFIIEDSLENLITSQDVKFDKDGRRQRIWYTQCYDSVFDKFTTNHIKQFVHIENGYTDPYMMLYYNIYTDDGDKTLQSVTTAQDMVDKINDFLQDKDYGLVSFIYGHDSDVLEVNYLYKVTFDGKKEFTPLNNDAYFTNTAYTFKKVNLVGSNMKSLATLRADVHKFVDGRPVNNSIEKNQTRVDNQGEQYQIIFTTPGTYRIELKYPIPGYILGDDARTTYITFYQLVEVKSDKSDVQIRYKTDIRHPFRDGTLEKTVTYNLGEGITMLGFDSKSFDNSKFSEGRSADTLFMWGEQESLYGETYEPNQFMKGEDFINAYNSRFIQLNAIWEIKLKIECTIGNRKKTVIASLDKTSNQYVVTLPIVQNNVIPKDHVFAGWQAPFIGGISKDRYVRIPYRDDYYDTEKYVDYLKATAIFKKEFSVNFYINPDIAYAKPSEIVLDGDCIINPLEKTHIKFIKQGYTFEYYYDKSDINKKPIDLATYPITKNTVFVAVFTDSAGRIVE